MREFKNWEDRVAALQAAYWAAKAKAASANRELADVERDLEALGEDPGRVSYGFGLGCVVFHCEALCSKPVLVHSYDRATRDRILNGSQPCLCSNHAAYAPLIGALRTRHAKGYELLQLAFESRDEADRRVFVDYYLELGGTNTRATLRELRVWLIEQLPPDERPVDLRPEDTGTDNESPPF